MLRNTNDTQIDLYINGSNEFRFEADGDFHADGDVIAYSTTTPSDERLKAKYENRKNHFFVELKEIQEKGLDLSYNRYKEYEYVEEDQ